MKQVVLVLLVLACMVSCKTTKTSIVDNSHIQENTNVKTEQSQDSIATHHMSEQQTEKTEKETTTEDTTIKFGEGGGTYNTKTGDATNVADVKLHSKTEKLRQENKLLKEENTTLHNENKCLTDSLSHLNKKMDIDSETEETYQAAWYWWLVIGMLVMFIIVVTIRRIPVISWLLCWI